ncbi:hypothetical protein KIH74_30550 [Kineosporia sp. J2-2]|uniref:Sulfotransferase family protein n=1 Tax=Kineosporia corallincola TaxID=2835133 RepID=A0ABS5TQD7_9ACTN|nr:hypothetical protein [Kineosporia corallincola]MBT0773325.1 hypothetical protein [Kineosporia corallincola]
MNQALDAERERRRTLFARIRDERDAATGYLRDRFPQEREYLDRAAGEVRDVAVVLGSPRGGTSVFKQTLAGLPGALALPGEHRLLFTLLGLNHPDHGRPDEAVEHGPLDPEQRRFLLGNLLFECRGEEIAEPTADEWERYAWDWALRLRVQWPDTVDTPLEKLVAVISDAVSGHRAGPEPALDVLRALRAHGLPVDPYRYDLDEKLVREAFPGLPVPQGPPGGAIVEISPFLALRPQRRPEPGPGRRVLVIKASSDAYRIPLLHDLFTGWNLRELHLTRNPLASVNGLLDGWDHRSFWQHDLSGSGVAVGPYADWNFDLCEGWQDLVRGPLTELCARQWSDPHRRILRHAHEPLRLPFEDFQAGGQQRRDLVARAAAHVGLGVRDENADVWAGVDRPRQVNVTTAPGNARWLRERPHLRELLGIREVAEVSGLLGYDVRRYGEWL